jgi:hypothetical protein
MRNKKIAEVFGCNTIEDGWRKQFLDDVSKQYCRRSALDKCRQPAGAVARDYQSSCHPSGPFESLPVCPCEALGAVQQQKVAFGDWLRANFRKQPGSRLE